MLLLIPEALMPRYSDPEMMRRDRDWVASPERVAERLKATREALGLRQAELCRAAGISRAAWNNAETADNRLSVNDALKLFEAFQIPLSWVYQGQTRELPHDLAQKIDKLMRRRG